MGLLEEARYIVRKHFRVVYPLCVVMFLVGVGVGYWSIYSTLNNLKRQNSDLRREIKVQEEKIRYQDMDLNASKFEQHITVQQFRIFCEKAPNICAMLE